MELIYGPIARMDNIEDNCSGWFWESRFSSLKRLKRTEIRA